MQVGVGKGHQPLDLRHVVACCTLQVSELVACRVRLAPASYLSVTPRGLVEMKGKGAWCCCLAGVTCMQP